MTISAQPKKKTVADAWEALKGNSPFVGEDKDAKYLYYYDANGFVTHNIKFPDDINIHFVCTREQFEEYGKEQEAKQEDDEWTHIYCEYEECRLLSKDPDAFGMFAIETYSNGFVLCAEDELKPIKPTLTKA
jgi:hypothetical protein